MTLVPEGDIAAASGRLDKGLIGTVRSINISSGGVPKIRVTDAQVTRYRVVGDAQNDIKHHGGPERAVCVYSLERIRLLQREGHPIDIGTAGENITVEGINWDLVVPGARIRCGSAVELEVASFTNPCKTIKDSFIDGRFGRISQLAHPGWSRVYARVLAEGQIRVGDQVVVVPPGS
ncbi:MAG TPA: MOSC domain-containing protein [Gemmatimonadaceae bacterium]|nr:MOSC domain-containing protein [Gemmatimonadaceae bacterium]